MRAITLSLIAIFLAACSSACSGGAGSGQDAAAQPVGTAPAPQPAPPPPPPPVAAPVVFIGDSITELWAALPGFNAGVSGQITAQMLARFEADVLSRRPSVVVILGGTNDVYRSAIASIDNVSRMADMAAAAGACVIVGTLPPVFVADDLAATIAAQHRWNREIFSLAESYGYLIADYRSAMEDKPEIFADGVHPNAAGYQIMLDVIQPILRECEAR